ncbi:hypothetical protein PVK06_044598 [Gossypium arboreum]|uniref:Uncharacterized protein n=1 Tax=Gossypium arboreum TaxID=29729 RepID=A0ABR0MRM3_GOSAR|nr:hypothetical protein PVK06_044598 [Gossypium arboreum]
MAKGKQGLEESPVSPEHEMVQEIVVKVSLPTLGNNNPELGTEALTRLVREVLEEVSEARVKAYGETLQARPLECSAIRANAGGSQERVSDAGSKEHRVQDCTVPFKSGGGVGLEFCG